MTFAALKIFCLGSHYLNVLVQDDSQDQISKASNREMEKIGDRIFGDGLIHLQMKMIRLDLHQNPTFFEEDSESKFSSRLSPI